MYGVEGGMHHARVHMSDYNPSRRAAKQTCMNSGGAERGFSVIELSFVTIIILIISATAIPSMISSMRLAHLRGAASDLSGLYEQARIYAIRDNNYYATYILTAATGSQIV